MKTTNSLHRKTAATTRNKTLNDPPNGHTALPVTGTGNSSLAHPLLTRHTTTRLSKTTSDASEGASSRSFGFFRRRVRRLFHHEQQDSAIQADRTPEISPIEPYLHLCPDGLHRCYQPLPAVVRFLTVCLATSVAFLSTNRKKMLSGFSFFVIRQTAMLLFKSIAYTLIAQVILQDTLFAYKRPSRVTMKTLMQKYFLPSSLSKYEPITVDAPQAASASNATIQDENPTDPVTLGVHYLRYDNDEDADEDESAAANSKGRSFGAMYFQHGFGASSLSWLPVLPKLAKQMNARVALGHDTVGFGFTDRPKDARWYRPKQAARIAKEIMAKESKASCDEKSAQPVCLVGHSMGSRATLRLATQLPEETPKLIVLSSPALGLIVPKSAKAPPSSFLAKAMGSVSTAMSRKVLSPVLQYVLRRVVGTNGSWRKGLEGAWGDPKKLTEESDVLRYSWPSIGYGWEEGILRFAGAQVLPVDDELDDDFLLMRKVLDLPNTKVLIVLGSKDMVIPTSSVKRFLERVKSSKGENALKSADVPIVELEGLGHCAFEEDREVFCGALEQLVRDHWDKYT